MSKVAKSFICRGCLNPVTSAVRTSVDIGASASASASASVGAFLQATSRVPRWWIGERPPDMAASCDIYK